MNNEYIINSKIEIDNDSYNGNIGEAFYELVNCFLEIDRDNK